MEVTISLPDKVFANVANVAERTHRRVDEVIAEKIERDFSLEIEELERQIVACSLNLAGTFLKLSAKRLADARRLTLYR